MDIEAITAQILTAIKSSLEQNQQQIIAKAAESAASTLEDNLKRKESDVANNAVQGSVKMLKTEQPTFKRDGNKNQFKHNVEVYQHLETAGRFLTDNNVEDAKKEIRQGKEKQTSRQHGQKIDFREDKFDRKCFICGRQGHLLYNCPDIKY